MIENILESLNLLWKGMLAVFLVMAVIFLVVLTLNLITKALENRKQAKLKENADSENTGREQ